MRFKEPMLWGLCVNYRMTRVGGDDNIDTYYKVIKRGKGEKPIHLRISNHLTDLSTWRTEGKRDPRNTINISIALQSPEEIEAMTPHKAEGSECPQDSFDVLEYVYDYKALSDEDCKINDAIRGAIKTGVYMDPHADDPNKKAVINILRHKVK